LVKRRVVFLRKLIGISIFVEQCFVHWLLMWWNGVERNGILSSRMTLSRKRTYDALSPSNGSAATMASRSNVGVRWEFDPHLLSHHGKYPPFFTA
jgi:hypothetical protein